MTNIKTATIEDLQRWGDDAAIMELGRRALDMVVISKRELEDLKDATDEASYEAGTENGYELGHDEGYENGIKASVRKAKHMIGMGSAAMVERLNEDLDGIW